MSDNGNENREELYSVRVRAGKRTYFFDVKETRGKDLYMTITESKRNFDNDGNVNYHKHKLFLYREDFEKFEDGFIDATDKIKELMTSGDFRDPIAERKAQDDTHSSDTADAQGSSDKSNDESDVKNKDAEKADDDSSNSSDDSSDDSSEDNSKDESSNDYPIKGSSDDEVQFEDL